MTAINKNAYMIHTKTYINDDISIIYPMLEEIGFTIHKFCVNGTFYDTWIHPNANIKICSSFKRTKKKRKILPWIGSWDNFHINIIINNDNIDNDIKSRLNYNLKKEIADYIGGRMEIKTTINNNHVHKNIKEAYDIYPATTKDDKNIRKAVQTLLIIASKTKNREQVNP